MKPNGGGEPTGKLAEAIKRDFGSYDEFKNQFKTAGMTQVRRRWLLGNQPCTGTITSFVSGLSTQVVSHQVVSQLLPSCSLFMQFGSGWAWLVTDKSGKLSVTKTPNAVVPVVEGKTPILTVDVWEHAYYIDFQVMMQGMKTWNMNL
jgi:Fe-Mn family superoxide dismutase